MKKRMLLFPALLLFTFMVGTAYGSGKGLVIHYDFAGGGETTVRDAAGNVDAKLMDGAVIRRIGNYAVMDLGANDGWLDMGAGAGKTIRSLDDFTVATYIYIYPDADVRANGNFVWAFSTQDICTETTGEYCAFKVNIRRYEQSVGGWHNEVVGVETGTPAAKGVWMHVAYAQSGQTGRLYVDGVEVASGPAAISPSDLPGDPSYNWLGKAPFRRDINLKAVYHDFRIYDRGVGAREVKKLSKKVARLNRVAIPG